MAILEAKTANQLHANRFIVDATSTIGLMISAEPHLRPELKHGINKKALSATALPHALTKIEDD